MGVQGFEFWGLRLGVKGFLGGGSEFMDQGLGAHSLELSIQPECCVCRFRVVGRVFTEFRKCIDVGLGYGA